MARPIRPPTKRIRVARYAKRYGHAPITWQRALRAIDWNTEARLLKATEETSVWRVPVRLPGNMTVGVVKCQRLTVKRRVQSLLRASRAHRQWDGARRLLRAGIPAARPMVILQTKGRSKPIETLFLQNLNGPTLLEYLAREHATMLETRRMDAAVIHAVATLLRRMQKARLYNRDGKPSNLVLTRLDATPGEEAAEIAVVDTVAIERRRWTREALVRALADLYTEPLGCDCAPSNRACMRLLVELAPREGRRRRHALFRDVRREVLSRGDPTPKDNPLAAAEADPDAPPLVPRRPSGAELRVMGRSIAAVRARAAAQAALSTPPSPSAGSPEASPAEPAGGVLRAAEEIPPDPEPIPLAERDEEPKPMPKAAREPKPAPTAPQPSAPAPTPPRADPAAGEKPEAAPKARHGLDELLAGDEEAPPAPKRGRERSIDDILEELGGG